MSLFEDPIYQWRETYFILFRQGDRPPASVIEQTLRQLDPRYELSSLEPADGGEFESITVKSPDDFSAMDVLYVAGEEVDEQIKELLPSLRPDAVTSEQRQAIARADARLDVLHFEQLTSEPAGEEEDFLDPASLLMVLEQLGALCRGVVVDPQTGTVF